MNGKKDVLDQDSFFHGTKAQLKIGDFENDPNLTDKRFPGNLTRSYRSKSPLKIVAELGAWERHSDEEINHKLASLKALREQGKAIILD